MTDKIKRGDLLPRWEATLYDGEPVAGNEVDLSTATTVKVIFTKPDGSVVTRVVSGTAAGVVVMDWQTGDTAVAGDLLFEVEVIWPGTKPQTFPVDDFLVTRVYLDMG